MSGKTVNLKLLASVSPALNLRETVDKAIQTYIDLDVTGTSQRVFNYYDSPQKPLTNREFIQFWESLSTSEKAAYYEHFFV